MLSMLAGYPATYLIGKAAGSKTFQTSARLSQETCLQLSASCSSRKRARRSRSTESSSCRPAEMVGGGFFFWQVINPILLSADDAHRGGRQIFCFAVSQS